MLNKLLSFFRDKSRSSPPSSVPITKTENGDDLDVLYEPLPPEPFDSKYDDWKEWPTPDWDERRLKVLERDHYFCQAPGCLHNGSSLDVHHIQARWQGGNHSLENLVTLCRVHHAFVHLGTNTIEVLQPNCSIVSQHWRNGTQVRANVRRYEMINGAELREIRKHFRLKCRCGSEKWEGHFQRRLFQRGLIWTWCPSCNGRWEFEPGLVEETGTHLATAFLPDQNVVRRFQFDIDLIQGIKKPVFFEGCPKCLQDGTRGYLVRWNSGLKCSERPMCKYFRPIYG